MASTSVPVLAIPSYIFLYHSELNGSAEQSGAYLRPLLLQKHFAF